MPKQHKQPTSQSSFSFSVVAPSFAGNPNAALIVAGIFGVVMLVINLSYHVIGDYNVETDFYWSYVHEARKMMAGEFPIEDFRGPAYPVLLGGTSILIGDYFKAGVILSTLSAALTLFFVYRLLEKLFRPDTAFIGALLVAVNTTFIQYSYTAGTDMMFNALVCATVFFLLKDEQRIWKSIILSAVAAGVAYLTRYNGIFIVVAVPVVLVWVNPYRLSMKERIATSAVYLGVFALVISPWGYYCLQERGSFFYNKNYLNIAYEMFAKGRMSWDQFWVVESQRYTSLAQVVFSDVGAFIKTVLYNIVSHAGNDLGKLVGWYTGVFSIIGAAMFFSVSYEKRVVSYFVLALGFFAVLLLVFHGERFSLFLLPAYVALALMGLSHPKLARWRVFGRMHAPQVIVAVLFLWTAGASFVYNSKNIDIGPKEVLELADALKRSGVLPPPGAVIVTRKPHVAYYLGMEMKLFPLVESFDSLKAEVYRANASYLYFSTPEAILRRQFESLLNPVSPVPWLETVAYVNYPPSVLFKVLPDSTR
ncbi:MAG TPA: glycosyltransferase family 39 protein [Bacteroidota bacterium]